MDGQRFDLLVRLLQQAGSRRGTLGLVLGGAVAPLFGPADIDAKRNKKKRRRRKKKRQKKTNQPFCAGKDACVDGYEQSRCNDGAPSASAT